jgi:hypothetical protein
MLMEYLKFRCLMAVILSLVSFVNYCESQATDPKIVEAAKKEGGEIEAYVSLRTDTAQYIWKMFEAKEQRLPGRNSAARLDPAFIEINAEEILALSIEDVQDNFRKYLEEYRTYFGK